MSSSLAILVSAAMLISFIADSEIVCRELARGAAGLAELCRGAAAGAAGVRSAGLRRGGGGGCAAVLAWQLDDQSSTVRPVLRRLALRPATPGHQTTIQTFTGMPHPFARVSLSTLVPTTPVAGTGCDASHATLRDPTRDPGWRESTSKQHGERPRAENTRRVETVEFLRRRIAAPRITVSGQIHKM